MLRLHKLYKSTPSIYLRINLRKLKSLKPAKCIFELKSADFRTVMALIINPQEGLPEMTIMKMEKIFSLSVSEATFPNPTLVMQVMV